VLYRIFVDVLLIIAC